MIEIDFRRHTPWKSKVVEHMDRKTFLGGLITGILLTAITLNSTPFRTDHTAAAPSATHEAELSAKPVVTSTPTNVVQVSDILPASANLGISFGDAIVKMVQGGAIDKVKFTRLYGGRKALTKEQLQLLETPSNQDIVVTPENAALLLNLLWPLGIANKSAVLSQGPIGTQFRDKAGSFASTGGWNLGKTDGGKLFNSLSIVRLTAEQEIMAREMAQHIFRPCCENPTDFPDCNHGAAMLGFIELAISQGLAPDKIYEKALILNTYWFPQNYAELATYFKARKNLVWQQVAPRDVLAPAYSGASGFGAIHAELEAEGLTPKPQDAGGCAA
jgi:hypothetical protein